MKHLARLARSYFRSHAPAVLQDFIWWSGLPVSEAKQAIYLIESELTAEHGMDKHGMSMRLAELAVKCPVVCIFFLHTMNIC